MNWTLHFLEAEGSLAKWRERLTAEACETHDRIAAHLPDDAIMSAVDVVIERVSGRTIPELGLGGHAFRRGCMIITLDPENPNFEASLAAGQFTRTVTHEFHHCLRHAGAGYGTTLGEAIVSEGLADHFDQQINGGSGQIWNHALEGRHWSEILRFAEYEIDDADYNHDKWFYGANGPADQNPIPRWCGYTIGYHLLERYFAVHGHARAARMAGTPAHEIISEVWSALAQRQADQEASPLVTARKTAAHSARPARDHQPTAAR